MKAVNKEILQIKAVEKNAEFIKDLNRQQLLSGENSLKAKVQPEYRSGIYADFKQGMNSKPEHGTPDLFLTGDFQASFVLTPLYRIDGLGAAIHARDKKTAGLVAKYGIDIFGIQERFMPAVQEKVTGTFIDDWKKAIGL
jgi:hypothetical protein